MQLAPRCFAMGSSVQGWHQTNMNPPYSSSSTNGVFAISSLYGVKVPRNYRDASLAPPTLEQEANAPA